MKVATKNLTKVGVERGFEVTHIDGVPVLKYAQKYITPYVCASTEQDLIVKTYDYMLLSGKVGT